MDVIVNPNSFYRGFTLRSSFESYLCTYALIDCYLLYGNMENETETEKTISRDFVILAIFQYRNTSLNDSL